MTAPTESNRERHEKKIHRYRRHRRGKRGAKSNRKPENVPVLQLVTTTPAVVTSLRSRLSLLNSTKRTA